MRHNPYFSRGPTHVQQELAIVLPQRASWPFAALFDAIFSNLRQKNRVSGGKEMLRLRLHERLQKLVTKGAVRRSGGEYHPDSVALAALHDLAEASQATKQAQRTERMRKNGQRMKRIKSGT